MEGGKRVKVFTAFQVNAPFTLIPASSSYFLQDFVPKKIMEFPSDLRTGFLRPREFHTHNALALKGASGLDRSGLSSKQRLVPFIRALQSVSDNVFYPPV